jgi:probable F420-dependent oxidoreductase
VKFGVHLPQWGPTATRSGVIAVAQAAENAGFDSVWVGDHIVWPTTIRSQYPFADRPPTRQAAGYLDAFTTLAVVAGATDRVRLGIGTLILPLRHPLVVAKAVSSLDVLSDGRTELAVGAGWMKEEFDALGVPFDERGRRMDESLGILRDAWSNGEVSRFDGPYPFEEVACRPLPLQPRGPRLWIGGMTRHALRRVLALGDGWYSVGFDPARLKAALEFLGDEYERRGRPRDSIRASALIAFDREAGLLGEKIQTLADMGMTQVVFGGFGTTVDPLLGAIDAFRKVRDALSHPG